MVKCFFVGFARVGEGERDRGTAPRYRARFFVQGPEGQRTAFSRAAFPRADRAVRYGRRMARALRLGMVSAERVLL